MPINKGKESWLLFLGATMGAVIAEGTKVMNMKRYFVDKASGLIVLKEKLRRRWAVNSAIIHERVSNTSNEKYF